MSAPYPRKAPAEKVAADLSHNIASKTILVTGVTPGSLGAAFIAALAPHTPRLLILAGRSAQKSQALAATLPKGTPTRILTLDLADQTQIRAAAAEVNAYEDTIDLLVNNAAVSAVPYGKTPQGLEMHFGVNYIGHFLFTNLIVAKLAIGARILNVASGSYCASPIRFDDYNFADGKTYNRFLAYAQSKTATLLYTLTLSRKLPEGKGITVLAVDPGTVLTTPGASTLTPPDVAALEKLSRDLGFPPPELSPAEMQSQIKTVSEGAAGYVYAGFKAGLEGWNGRFVEGVGELVDAGRVRCWGRDGVEGERLWSVAEGLVGQRFGFE